MGSAVSVAVCDRVFGVQIPIPFEEVTRFQDDLVKYEQARCSFCSFIMSLESTKEIIRDIDDTENEFAAFLTDSFQAGLVKSDIMKLYLSQFFKSDYYKEYSDLRDDLGTPALTRQNSLIFEV